MDSVDEGRADLAAWRENRPRNYYHTDPLFSSLMEGLLGPRYTEESARLEEAGALSAERMDELARESNRDENLPRLRGADEFGYRTEDVRFHPSYHELGALVWSTGGPYLARTAMKRCAARWRISWRTTAKPVTCAPSPARPAQSS